MEIRPPSTLISARDATAATACSSSSGSCSCSAFHATARYIAPVSMCGTPSAAATALATVPFPAPDGPSIATISFFIVCRVNVTCGFVRTRRLVVLILVIALIAGAAMAVAPYISSLLLVVRGANLGGRLEAFANQQAHTVSVHATSTIPTRHGAVTSRLYEPSGGFTRTVLMIPGIHAAGIDEPRLRALASDLAGSGVAVITMALPDLQHYRITPAST